MIDAKALRELCEELSVLYVEDEPEVREQTASILSSLFGEVRTAADGEAGLATYRERPADLVITDIMMPRMDGLEMAGAIKERDRHQHVAVISAYNETRYFAQAIRVGVDGFILKPLETAQLFELLQRIAGSIRERRENLRHRDHLEALVSEQTSELARQLVIDDLTGLYNRRQLTLRLERNNHFGLLLLNLDNFARFNTGYGLDIGNLLLSRVAEFLLAHRPPEGEVYRLASDEFAVALAGARLDEAEEYARGLHQALAHYTVHFREGIAIRPSATIAVVAGDGAHLLQQAHLAMLEARELGRNRVHVTAGYSALERRQQETLSWMNRVRGALEEGRMVPFFQPIIDNRDGRVDKYECLARIIEGEREISPFHFIEPAKLAGLIPEVTRAIARHAAETFRDGDTRFSINITDEDLIEPERVDRLLDELEGIAPERVIFEVLEGISITHSEVILAQLKRLKRLGYRIAIDDFGTEHSNFSRILDLEADFLKIDGRFVKELDRDSRSETVCRAITQLARSIGAEVIAEFVHSAEVQTKVLELGIDYSQGYHLGEPRPRPLK